MKRLTLAVVLVALMLTIPSMAQRGPASPHETITANIDGNDIKIVYGRPYSKNPRGAGEIRKIWGGLVPWGQPWRMGADQATTLTIAQPIQIGETAVPAGTYILYLIPQETGQSKMAISKRTSGWGIPVDESQDLARVDVKKEAVDPQVDQFTMAIDKNPAGGGVIKMTWEKTQFSVPFTVKK
jgi:hypothetical protein